MAVTRSILAAGGFALAALVAALALLGEWAGGQKTGAMFLIASPDRWLAILGLALALGAQDLRCRRVVWLTLIGGAVTGIAIRHSALWPFLSTPSVFRFVRLIEPVVCSLSGLGLLASDRWRTRVLPILALAMATGLWFTAAVNDPTSKGYGFVAGFSLACTCLALAAACLRVHINGSWTSVGERIAGSWLLTIGILLSATQWFPAAPPVIDAPLPPAPFVGPSGLSEPDGMIRPYGQENSMGFGGPDRLPKGTN